MPLYQITQDTIQDYYQRKQKNGGRLDGRKGGLSAKTIRRLKQRENIFTKTRVLNAKRLTR